MMFLLWDSHGGFCVSRRRGKQHKQHLSSLITLHETCEQKRNVAKSMASIYLCPYCFVGALLPCLQRLNLNLQLRHSLSFSMHPASIRIDFTAIWTSDLVRRAFAPPVEVSKAPCEGMVLVDLVQWTKSQDSFKTFQNNQNRREAIELKSSCEPSVFQGGNPPKGLRNHWNFLQTHRITLPVLSFVISEPKTHRHRSSLYPCQREVLTNKIKTGKTFQAKKNKTSTKMTLKKQNITFKIVQQIQQGKYQHNNQNPT